MTNDERRVMKAAIEYVQAWTASYANPVADSQTTQDTHSTLLWAVSMLPDDYVPESAEVRRP